MSKIEASVLISSAAGDVWEFITDLSNAPKWDPAALEMTQTSDGPAGPGMTLHLTLSEYPKVEDFRVEDYQVNRRFTLEYTSGPVKGTRMSFELAPADGNTELRLVWDLRYAGIGRLIGPLITRNARREGATFVANIKRLVEAEALAEL